MLKSGSLSSHSSHSAASNGSGSMAGRRSSTLFPLPDDYFGESQLTQEQEDELQALVEQRLAAALADERAIRSRQAQHLPRLDPREWKFVTNHDQLQIYRSKRRRAPSSFPSRKPRRTPMMESDYYPDVRVSVDEDEQRSMIGVGHVEGSIEDIVYGVYATTRAEMKTNVASLDNTTWDCSVLHCVQAGTEDDPFRLLTVQWMLSRFASTMFIAPRDWCFVTASGIRIDAEGERFGYVVTHSVPMANCPPFDYKQTGVIRGKIFSHFLLREASPGNIEVSARCIFDPAGELIRTFVNIASAKLITGFFRCLVSAEAKKLTVLARRNTRRLVQLGLGKPEIEDLCSVCIKRGGTSMFSSVRLKLCGVCGVTVCTKCAAKKDIFTSASQITKAVRVCPGCLLQTQQMTNIDPNDAEFAVVSDMFHGRKPTINAHSHLSGMQLLDEESSSHSSGPSGSSSSKSRRRPPKPEFDNLGRMLLNKKADAEEFTRSYQSDRETAAMEYSVGYSDDMDMYPDDLSDLDSAEYHFSEDGDRAKEEVDPEQELLRLLKNHSLGDSLGPSSRPAPTAEVTSETEAAVSADVHETSLYQRMLEIQNTAQQVFELTQANERIIENLR